MGEEYPAYLKQKWEREDRKEKRMEELTWKYGGYRLAPHAKKKQARWKFHLKWITMFVVAWLVFFALGLQTIAGAYKIINFLMEYEGISATLVGFVALYAAISVTYNFFYNRR